MSFRFLHASDLHIGRRFGALPEPPDGHLRGRLTEARHAVIARLAQAARARGIAHILLAGDTFDTATPSATVIRQALSAMGEDAGVTWWLLPGNHDNLKDGEPLWAEIARHAPPNLRALARAEALEMAPGVHLLPCPLSHRATGGDPSEPLMQMPTPDGALRIGLAHGGITDFSESGQMIAPDRDRRAGLDYLALGDWHGRMTVSPRTHYPGTPEQERFKHNRRGLCLAVTLPAATALPEIEEVETGQFLWSEQALQLHPGEDARRALAQLLPTEARRDTLVQVTLSGQTTLCGQAALQAAAADLGPDFALLRLRTEALGLQIDPTDLEDIDRSGGALRLAAEALQQEVADPERSAPERQAARAALARLYSYVQEEAR